MKNLKEEHEKDYAKNGMFAGVDSFRDLIVENIKPGITVAELGVFDGATTIMNLPIIKAVSGKYYAVDWFNGTDESQWGVNHNNLDHTSPRHYYREGYDQYIYPLFLENIKKTNCDDVCVVIKAKTEDAAALIPDGSLDICFIDAAHDYVNVTNDIKNYLPKVKKGGIICGHDYDLDHKELVKAVDDFFAKDKIKWKRGVLNTSPIWIVQL